MLLTKSGGWLGPVATILGYIMDAIFSFCNMLSLPNIGLCIILFTIVIYLLNRLKFRIHFRGQL